MRQLWFVALALVVSACPGIVVNETDKGAEVTSDTTTDTGGNQACEVSDDCNPDACHDATCSADGVCEYALKSSGWCFIDDTCVVAGGTSQQDLCQICDPVLTPDGFVAKQCGAGMSCVSGACEVDPPDVVEGTPDVAPDVPDATPDVPVPDVGPDADADATPDTPGDGSTGDATPDVPVGDGSGGDSVTPDATPDTPVADAVPDTPTVNGGDTCGDAIVLDSTSLPASASGTTENFTDDYSSLGVCADLSASGAGQPDIVYSFTPGVDGSYTIDLPGSDPNLVIVSTGCGNPASCVATAPMTSGPALVPMIAGTEYFIIVDGIVAANQGAFDLVVDLCQPDCSGKACGDDGCGGTCGSCPLGQACDGPTSQCMDVGGAPGDVCQNPFLVDAIPYSTSASTDTATPTVGVDPNACPGIGWEAGTASNDHFYHFTPVATASFEIRLTSTFDSALYVITDCENPSGSCLAGDDQLQGQGDEVLNITLEGGVPVIIVVDGWDPNTNIFGDYTLTIGDPCVPDCTGKLCGSDGCSGVCGTCDTDQYCDVNAQCADASNLDGNSCDLPFDIDGSALPFTASGSTGDATDVYSAGVDTCAGSPQGADIGPGSNDEAWRFMPPQDATYTITVTGSDFAPAVYLMEDCSDQATCAGMAYSVAVGSASLTVALAGGTVYFIIIDGAATFGQNEAGDYVLEISAPCVPDCTGKVCGTDGCGGSCGGCADAEACDPQGACADPSTVPGAVCSTAHVITDALPISLKGDTTDLQNSMTIPDPSMCQGLSFPGGDAVDEWWSFTPPSDGTYQFELANYSGDQGIFIFSDCADPSGSCLGGMDEAGSAPEIVTLTLAGGTPVYILIDGYTPPDVGPYDLNITSP